MRAIKSNSAEEGNKKNQEQVAEDTMDTLDLKSEKDSNNGETVSSVSKIKTVVSSKSLVIVGMVGFVGWMMYSTFIKKPPPALDENGQVIQQEKDNKNVPLSKIDVKKTMPQQIATKEDEQDNPFKKMSTDAKDQFGQSISLEDPDLPPLDLSKDASYLNPTAPGASKAGLQLPQSGEPVGGEPGKKAEEKVSLSDVSIVGTIPPPKWVNLSSKEQQSNPEDPTERYDPSTRILYRNGQKYLVQTPADSNSPQAPSLELGSAVGSGGKKSAGGGGGIIGSALPQDPYAQRDGSGNPIVSPISDSVDGKVTDERKLSMFVLQGSPPSSSGKKNDGSKKDFIIMDESLISERKTDSTKSSVKKLSNLDTSVLGGKIIDAVLETALNTQMPGNARAVVSHDVYGETGDKVLIPKGSRLYGTYSSTVTRGQSRIQISWSRIMRPDGVDVTISAQASDQFGRTGIRGDVDSRIGDSIANSILMTMTTLGAGLLAQQLGTGQGQSQVVNPNGTFTTTNITPLNYAAQAAIQTATEMISNLTQGSQNLAPVISLPQGTRIKIIMDQDIRLPPFKKIVLP